MANPPRQRRSREELENLAREALGRAASGTSIANYATIYGEFINRGIPENEIKPRENVFTYHAWKGLGRFVRKGEHGVKITVWIPIQDREPETGASVTKLAPTTAVVFHVTQTEAASERKVA